MKIAVVGSGAREHALCWALAKEAEVVCVGGNPGIAEDVRVMPTNPKDLEGVRKIIQDEAPDLVVIGPEDPLILGLADLLRGDGQLVFGPGQAGAQLEGSKAFSKELMQRCGVPTARFQSFQDAEPAKEFAASLCSEMGGVVVKASGNALGKGVLICNDVSEANAAIESLLVDRIFGEAGSTIVVEDLLVGPEFSLITLVSGTHYWSFPVAQDFKRAYDGNKGPNTGGMGSFTPVPNVSMAMVRETENTVVAPILNALSEDGIDFRGALFSGLLVHGGKPYCLEYNVRFGDPEIESLAMCIESGFADALIACARGEKIPPVAMNDSHAVTVVVASKGYPNAPQTGFPLTCGLGDFKLFHAGTKSVDVKVQNSGGRVIACSALGDSIAEARMKAYEGARSVSFAGAWYRSDIAASI